MVSVTKTLKRITRRKKLQGNDIVKEDPTLIGWDRRKGIMDVYGGGEDGERRDPTMGRQPNSSGTEEGV